MLPSGKDWQGAWRVFSLDSSGDKHGRGGQSDFPEILVEIEADAIVSESWIENRAAEKPSEFGAVRRVHRRLLRRRADGGRAPARCGVLLRRVREFGDSVLELGCGTGRVTMALAERGYRVTGLDLSKPMLERAEEKRAKLPAEERALVHLLHGDMTRFELRENFSLVIIPFRPFQHLLEQTSKFLVSTLCAGTLPRKAVDSGNGAAAHPGCFPDRRAKHARPDVSRGESGRRMLMTDGCHVKTMERVAAFHRALQRNDVGDDLT